MKATASSACPVCRAPDAQEALVQQTNGRAYPFLRCSQCGLLFVSIPPTDQELRDWYDHRWVEEYEERSAEEQQVDQQLQEQRFRHRLAEMRRFASQGRRLLDIGCQNGTFLVLARAEGWEPRGVELAPAAVEQARQQGLDVVAGTLAQARFPAASFDVVTLWHLLEHLPQPLELLEEIRRILKPRGLLAIETPNVDSRAFRRQGANWEYLLAPQHLCYFGVQSLGTALEQTGYHVVCQRCEGGTGIALRLARAGLGGMRLWLRKYYRVFAPLRSLYLALFGWAAAPDDILVVYARANEPASGS